MHRNFDWKWTCIGCVKEDYLFENSCRNLQCQCYKCMPVTLLSIVVTPDWVVEHSLGAQTYIVGIQTCRIVVWIGMMYLYTSKQRCNLESPYGYVSCFVRKFVEQSTCTVFDRLQRNFSCMINIKCRCYRHIFLHG